MLIHGSGVWGHGLNALVSSASLRDMTFPLTLEIADAATQSDIEAQLQDVQGYDIFVVQVLASLRQPLFAAANAWIGTEDMATQLLMEGVLAVRFETPISWSAQQLNNSNRATGVGMTYYAYDAVLTVAHALNYLVANDVDVTAHEALPAADYFAEIRARSTHGAALGAAIKSLQLLGDWMMTAPLYMVCAELRFKL